MPTSCLKCYLSRINPREKDNFDELITDFYIPILWDCIESGNVEAQKRKYNVTV